MSPLCARPQAERRDARATILHANGAGAVEPEARRPRRQCGRAARGHRRRTPRRRVARRHARAVAVRLSAGRPAAAPGVPRRVRSRSSRRSPRKSRGSRRSSAFPSVMTARATTRSPCCATGASRGIYRKHHLPNYTVFDEERYFEPGTAPCVFDVDGVRCGVVICEDCWFAGPAAAVARGRCAGRDRPERLAVSHVATGGAAHADRRARARDRRAVRVRQSRRRTGRARVRRRVVRHGCRRRNRAAASRVARDRRDRRIRRRAAAACARRSRLDARAERVSGAGDGRARLRRQESLPRRPARALGRRRFRADARRRRRRAGSRARARRHAAVAIQRVDQPRRRARDGAHRRRALRRNSDRPDVRRVSRVA